MARKISGTRTSRTGIKPLATDLVAVGALPGKAMAKTKPAAGATVFKEGGTTLLVAQPYVMGDQTVMTDAVFFVDGLKSKEKGPWLGEADKVAWRDEATGYECIIMRATDGGHLGGYVGVPPGHPLYAFENDAIPADFGIEVHGGLTYARMCEHGPAPQRRPAVEARRICHVSRPGDRAQYAPTNHAGTYRVEDADAWWFGFECNHVYDLVPGNREDRARFLAAETGAVYREETYVYDEVVQLAAQLRAIADGSPKPARTTPPPPPLGLDPRQGR